MLKFKLLNKLFLFVRYYLKGPKTGMSEVFIDGLPGMPDNIKKNSKGEFYLPLVMSRTPILDNIGRFPTVRMIIVKFLGLLQNTFEKINLFYPNIYCKKAAHMVKLTYIVLHCILYFLLILKYALFQLVDY